MMKTIQMTLDTALVEDVDAAVAKLNTSRSAFTREALRDALERLRVGELEERHRRGYLRNPAKSGEFDAWDDEQAWPE